MSSSRLVRLVVVSQCFGRNQFGFACAQDVSGRSRLLRRPPFTDALDLIATSPALSVSRDLCLGNGSMLFACDEYTFFDTYEMIKYVGGAL